MIFDLTGQTVEYVTCEVALEVGTTDGWGITVENEYEFRLADGSVLTTEGGEEERIVAVLTEAIGAPLTSFSYTDDGHLAFAVAAGEVRVEPLQKFESWNIVGPNKERVIALARGELAIWS